MYTYMYVYIYVYAINGCMEYDCYRLQDCNLENIYNFMKWIIFMALNYKLFTHVMLSDSVTFFM